MSAQTFTYTWTQTRLESIQDQFRYLLMHAGLADTYIDKIVSGVGEEAIQAIGVYGYDGTGLRVIETELRIDWSANAKLTLSMPTITGGLSGWDGKQAPETKVAGRRFAAAAAELRLSTNVWVSFVPKIRNNSEEYASWSRRLNVGGRTPAWKSPPEERDETYLDLAEAQIFMRRAGG